VAVKFLYIHNSVRARAKTVSEDMSASLLKAIHKEGVLKDNYQNYYFTWIYTFYVNIYIYYLSCVHKVNLLRSKAQIYNIKHETYFYLVHK